MEFAHFSWLFGAALLIMVILGLILYATGFVDSRPQSTGHIPSFFVEVEDIPNR